MSRLRHTALCHFCDRHLTILAGNVGDEKGAACLLRVNCEPDEDGNVRMGPRGRGILLHPVQVEQAKQEGTPLYIQHRCPIRKGRAA